MLKYDCSFLLKPCVNSEFGQIMSHLYLEIYNYMLNDRPPSWIYGVSIRFSAHALMLPIQKKNPNFCSRTPPANVDETCLNVPSHGMQYLTSILNGRRAKINCCRGARGENPGWTDRRPSWICEKHTGPPTGSTRPLYSIHWTLLQGLPKAGALQLVLL